MNCTKLLELAARCERAEAVYQSQLLHDAWDLIASVSASFRAFALAASPQAGFRSNADRFSMAMDAKAFESAAIMLVPEGCLWKLMVDYGLPGYAQITADDFYTTSYAATPALALTAAALKAHAEGAE